MVKIDVLYRKVSRVQRHLNRIKEKKHISESEFLSNQDVQESVLLNLQHAIQGVIDIGTHIVSDENWGVPGSLSDVFYRLETHNIIPSSLVEKLIPVVGFRNLIVHQYGDIDLRIVYDIYQNQLNDIEDFLKLIQANFPP